MAIIEYCRVRICDDDGRCLSCGRDVLTTMSELPSPWCVTTAGKTPPTGHEVTEPYVVICPPGMTEGEEERRDPGGSTP